MGTQLKDIVQINISRETARISRVGFGTPMILGEHARFTDRVRTYTNPEDMLVDGFLPTDNHYEAALALMSQEYSPTEFKVGRKLGDVNAMQKIVFTGIPTAGTWTITVGAETTATLNSDASTIDVTVALQALTAITTVTVIGTMTTGFTVLVVDPALTAVSTFTVDISSLTGVTAVAVTVLQAGSAVETWKVALAAVRNESADGDDDWYALGILSRTVADIQDMAEEIEAATPPKMFFIASQDSDIKGSGSSDIGTWLKNNSFDRTSLIYLSSAGQNAKQKIEFVGTPSAGTWTITLDTETTGTIAYDADAAGVKAALELLVGVNEVTVTGSMAAGFEVEFTGIDALHPFTTFTVDISSLTGVTDSTITVQQIGSIGCAEFAWMGGQLPFDPGSITWKFKSLVGITPDDLTSTEIVNLIAKYVNFYEIVANISMVTSQAVVASGEYVDTMRGSDWLGQRMAERIFIRLANALKVPFTIHGLESIATDVRAQLQQGIDRGFLVEGSMVVNVPDIDDIDPADKADRFFQGTTFSAQLAGAIHKVKVVGKLTI